MVKTALDAGADVKGSGGLPPYYAALSCGQTVYFFVAHFTPKRNDRVPCLRHEFCIVMHSGRTSGAAAARRRAAAVLKSPST